MKAVVAGLAIVVLVGAIVLWLVLSNKDPEPRARATPTDTEPRQAPPPPSLAAQRPTPPVITEGTGSAVASADVKEYEVGGMKVRDHRGGDQKPVEIPPNVHPPGGHNIKSSVTYAVSQNVKTALAACAADLPREARGQHPRLEGTITIAIKDHVATIKTATLKLADSTGDAVAPVQTCVEQRSLGKDAPAPDEPDLDSYSIGITYAVP